MNRLALAAAAMTVSIAACGGGDDPQPSGGSCGNGATLVDIGSTFDGNIAAGSTSSLCVQSPTDGTGGYLQATVGSAAGTLRATIYDGAGQTDLGTFAADAPGGALSFYWTSSPGQNAVIAIGDDGGNAGAYQLMVTYTQVADPFEPNDAMDAAAAIPDGGQMSAYLFAGGNDAASDPAAYDDYYRFPAQPGTMVIRLDDVPANLAGRVFVFRSDGSEAARVSSGVRGGPLVVSPPMIVNAEDYFIRISLWAEAPAAVGPGAELPASFTQAYRLSVSQTPPQPPQQ